MPVIQPTDSTKPMRTIPTSSKPANSLIICSLLLLTANKQCRLQCSLQSRLQIASTTTCSMCSTQRLSITQISGRSLQNGLSCAAVNHLAVGWGYLYPLYCTQLTSYHSSKKWVWLPTFSHIKLISTTCQLSMKWAEWGWWAELTGWLWIWVMLWHCYDVWFTLWDVHNIPVECNMSEGEVFLACLWQQNSKQS